MFHVNGHCGDVCERKSFVMCTSARQSGLDEVMTSRVTVRRWLCAVTLAVLLGALQHGASADVAFRPPDAVWQGDPNLEAFDDPVLAEIYRSTMVGIRTIAQQPVGPERDQAMATFRETPKSAEEIDHIVASASEAVNLGQWDRYRAALWSTQAGVDMEPRLVALSRQALEAPRGEKLSDAQGLAIMDTLEFLGRSPCQEAAALLNEAVTAAFWGEDPMRSRMLRTETIHSITMVRSLAIANLGRLPASLSLPLLEKLAKQYPDISAKSVPSDQYRFEMGAGYAIAEAIYNVKKREGIPGAVNPFEVLHGKSKTPMIMPD